MECEVRKNDPRCFLARLAFAVPDAAAREKILWRNLARLMESVGAALPGQGSTQEGPRSEGSGATTPSVVPP
jgi:hypothetical protein